MTSDTKSQTMENSRKIFNISSWDIIGFCFRSSDWIPKRSLHIKPIDFNGNVWKKIYNVFIRSKREQFSPPTLEGRWDSSHSFRMMFDWESSWMKRFSCIFKSSSLKAFHLKRSCFPFYFYLKNVVWRPKYFVCLFWRLRIFPTLIFFQYLKYLQTSLASNW